MKSHNGKNSRSWNGGKAAPWILVSIVTGCLAAAGCDGGGGEEDAADDGGTDDLADPRVDETADVPDDDGGGEPEVTDDGGGDDPAGDEGAGVTLTVIVQEELEDETFSPLEGATVALDAPGGGRSEETTGSNGRATFTGLDFSLGTAMATAHREGFILKSVVTAGETEGELEMTLKRDQSDFVDISGTAENMTGGANYLLFSATVPHSYRERIGPVWSMPVKTGLPFSLVAIEFSVMEDTNRRETFNISGWTVAQHDAVSGPETVAINLSETASTTQVQGSFALPSRPESILRAEGWSLIYVFADLAWMGISSHTELSTDGGSYNYEVEYVEVPGATEITTMYTAFQGHGAAAGFSCAIVEGLPTEGSHDFGLLDMPGMIAPAGSSIADAEPLHDPIEWELYDDGTVVVELYRRSTYLRTPRADLADWEIVLPPGSTTVVIPELPSTVDADQFYDESIVYGRVWVHQVPDSGEVLERWASGFRFILVP